MHFLNKGTIGIKKGKSITNKINQNDNQKNKYITVLEAKQ